MSLHVSPAASAVNGQADFDVGQGNVGPGFVSPFNEADAAIGKVLFQPGFEEFVRVIESIKIKVIQ